MLQSEVINKLTKELCLAQGTFDYFTINRTYIQMALSIGIEHYTKDMEEIVALYQDGSEAGRFKSFEEASRKLGISQTCISEVVRGTQHTAGGLQFIRAKDYDLVPRNSEVVTDTSEHKEHLLSKIISGSHTNKL